MNMMTDIPLDSAMLSRGEAALVIAMAARTVPPLWPLENAIAVNPLSGFEDLCFDEALSEDTIDERNSTAHAAQDCIAAVPGEVRVDR